jgi:hypothetical protein
MIAVHEKIAAVIAAGLEGVNTACFDQDVAEPPATITTN